MTRARGGRGEERENTKHLDPAKAQRGLSLDKGTPAETIPLTLTLTPTPTNLNHCA